MNKLLIKTLVLSCALINIASVAYADTETEKFNLKLDNNINLNMNKDKKETNFYKEI